MSDWGREREERERERESEQKRMCERECVCDYARAETQRAREKEDVVNVLGVVLIECGYVFVKGIVLWASVCG